MLIVAVWTLSILSLLALGAGYHAWLEMKLTALDFDRIKEDRMISAAVALSRGVLPKDLAKPATLKDSWADNAALFREVRLEEGTFSVVRRGSRDDPSRPDVYGLEDESGRVSLNKAPKDSLRALMGSGADEAAQAIVDWRQDISDDGRRSEPDDFYSGLPNPYPCKHAGFESQEELLLVREMNPERYSKLKPWTTVYGDHVNINTAPREVLRALGLSAGLVDEILDYRKNAEASDAASGDGVFASVSAISQDVPMSPEENAELAAIKPLLGVSSRAFRLHLELWPGNSPIVDRKPVRYEVVLEYKKGGKWAIRQVARD